MSHFYFLLLKIWCWMSQLRVARKCAKEFHHAIFCAQHFLRDFQNLSNGYEIIHYILDDRIPNDRNQNYAKIWMSPVQYSDTNLDFKTEPNRSEQALCTSPVWIRTFCIWISDNCLNTKQLQSQLKPAVCIPNQCSIQTFTVIQFVAFLINRDSKSGNP